MATISVSFEQARSFLTPPPPAPVCFNLDDVETHFGVTYTSEQREALASIPFSEQVLRESAGTHLLFPGFPLSIVEMRKKKPRLFRPQNVHWYRNEPFATKERVSLSWHLLRMGAVPESLDELYLQQIVRLRVGDEVPRACEVTLGVLLHFLASGTRVLQNQYVRCIDLDSDGDRVFVGDFDSDGFRVGRCGDDYRDAFIGLASSVLPRKS